MAFRLVGSNGEVSDAAFINMYASGVVAPGQPVDVIRNGTGGAIVGPSAAATTATAIFGVSLDYAQGASDTLVRVVPFSQSQLWEVDCANAAATSQLGLRHYLSATRGYIHNVEADIGSNVAKATRVTAVFHALAMTGLTTGSGKLIGRFIVDQTPVVTDTQT